MEHRPAPIVPRVWLDAAGIAWCAYGTVSFLGVLYLDSRILVGGSVFMTAAMSAPFLAGTAAGIGVLLGRSWAVSALMFISAPLPFLVVYGACATVMLDASGPHPWSVAAVVGLLVGALVSAYSFSVTRRARRAAVHESTAA